MANQPKKYRKFLVGAASAALVATAVAPVASAADFSDMKGNTHEEAVNALTATGVITGYPNGTFQPNKTLKRSDVVKLMGKWLVSLGNDIPTDYKSNIRFNDLATSSDNELLQYAALVHDKGVFLGNEGALNPSGSITRENMALVLVRAYDSINGTDLVKTVEEATDFKSTVTDRASAKAEAQPYIDVLDYFNITTVAQFNPKTTTTRGHFASFLYRTIGIDEGAFELKISGVTALNDRNQFLRIDFSKAVTSGLAPSNINIKDAKSGETYGVKAVQLAANGMSAQVELFEAKENEDVLQYLTDYTITVNANKEIVTYTFNRAAFIEQYVYEVDAKNNKFKIKTKYGEVKTIEVPASFKDFDLYALLGEEVRVWYDDKNRLVDFKVVEKTAQYDAIEIKGKDEIKLIGADKSYDISDDLFTNSRAKVFSFYVNGKDVTTNDGEIPAEFKGQKFNHAKVGFDDSGDAISVSVYNLNNFIVVDRVEGKEIVGIRGEGTGGSFDADDATIIKDGKAIDRTEVKKGDILFFNPDANNDDGFAEVLSKTVAGKIQTVFDDSVRIDGKTYKFKQNIDIKDYNVDYDNAVFLNDDNETEFVDYDEAEELQAAGAVTLYTDRAGHVVYIGGDTANVERNTLISILTADIAGETQFNRDRIEVEAVYSTGEERLFDLGLKDLKSIIVDGKTYDIDNDAKTKYTAKLVGKAIQITNNSNAKLETTVQLAGTKGDVVKLHLDKDRKRLEKLEFYSTRSSHVAKAGLEKGDAYVDGKKLNNKTVVFDAKKFTNNASDIKTTTWGEYAGGKISDVTIAYDKDNEVLGLVINDTESDADRLEEAVIADVLRNTDQEVVEVTVFISGEKRTIKVDEVTSDIRIGEVAVLVFDDKNDKLVEDIYSSREFGSNSKLGKGYAFKGKVEDNAVDVGKREVTINGVTYKLANDGLVIDARTKTDIKTKSLTDLRGRDNVVAILDENNSTFVKFFVYGAAGINDIPNAPGKGQETVSKAALETAVTAAGKKVEEAVPGTKEGQFPQSAIDTYKKAIETAEKVVADKDATQKQVDAAIDTLAEATKEFEATKVPAEAAEIEFTNTTVEGKDLNLGGLHIYTIEGTVAGKNAAEVTEVKIVFSAGVPEQTATFDATSGKFSYKNTVGKYETITVVGYDAAGKKVVSKELPVTLTK